jgi:pimeloyl-ACP methyl ester carboxylesterase
VSLAVAADRFVTADGTSLFVRDTGPSDAPVTLVLAHGWTLDHTSWDRVVAALPATLRVLRYDHRGHGLSEPGPDGTATVAQVGDDLAALVAERVPSGRVVLAGHSMGGMAVMALAERHPALFAERVAGVGFVATSSGGLDKVTLGLPTWTAPRVAAVERRLNQRISRAHRLSVGRSRVARAGLRWLLFGSRVRSADVVATAAQVSRCDPAAMVAFRGSLGEHSRVAALAAMRSVPVVVLAGSADRLTSLPHARAIADALPAASFVVYPQAGHMLPYERAEDVAAHLGSLVSFRALDSR